MPQSTGRGSRRGSVVKPTAHVLHDPGCNKPSRPYERPAHSLEDGACVLREKQHPVVRLKGVSSE